MGHQKTKMITFFLDQGEFLGGAERFLIDFLKSLDEADKKRINPVVVGGKDKKYRELLLGISFEDFDYPSVRGNVFQKFMAVFRLISAAWKLKKLAEKNEVRCFFSNSPRTHFVMFLAKTIFRIPGKWICMFHDLTVPDFLLRQIALRADVLVANGIPMQKKLKACISQVCCKKIEIISNGIDSYIAPKASIPKEIKNILVLGRLDPRKGQMFALEAADLLKERYPDVKFTFVGSSVVSDLRTVEYEKKLLDFVKTRELSNVEFVPEVENPFEVINESALVLFLPTEPETFGRVVIEALALGKLVLAFDEVGPREILKEYEEFLGKCESHSLTKRESHPPTGDLRVKCRNSKILAKQIEYFLENPSLISFYTKRGRAFVEGRYSLERTKKGLVGVISD